MIRIPKNAREEVRLELSRFRGFDLVNVRVWWRPGEADEWRPSRKGLSLRVEFLPRLRAALEDLESEALRRGLLETEDYEEAGLGAPPVLLPADPRPGKGEPL